MAFCTWQALNEVVATLELMADFLPQALMSCDDLKWLVHRLESIRPGHGQFIHGGGCN